VKRAFPDTSSDEPEMQLSESQLENFAGWKRPGEIFYKPLGIDMQRDVPAEPIMSAVEGIDLVQDITADCSVVASLCVGTARGERGHTKVKES
jgi:calpain-7